MPDDQITHRERNAMRAARAADRSVIFERARTEADEEQEAKDENTRRLKAARLAREAGATVEGTEIPLKTADDVLHPPVKPE